MKVIVVSLTSCMSSAILEPKTSQAKTDLSTLEFKLPKVGSPRAAFLGKDSEPIILSKAIAQDIDIPGEVPAYLQKDKRVQEAALLKFRAAINAAKDTYFENRGSINSNQDYTDPKLQAGAKEAALQMANQFGLTKYSKKDLVVIVAGSLTDSLQRMNPESARNVVGYVLEVSKELGIEKDVLKDPGLQRSVLYAVKSSMDNAINIQAFSETFTEGIKGATQLAKIFETQTFNKEELLGVIGNRMNDYRQRFYHTKHHNTYAALVSMTDELGISKDFVSRKDVQHFGLFSVAEKFKTMASVDGKTQLPELAKDISEIVALLDLFPARTKELTALLNGASHSASQILTDYSSRKVDQALAIMAYTWDLPFTPKTSAIPT